MELDLMITLVLSQKALQLKKWVLVGSALTLQEKAVIRSQVVLKEHGLLILLNGTMVILTYCLGMNGNKQLLLLEPLFGTQ